MKTSREVSQTLTYQDIVCEKPSLPRGVFCGSKCCARVDKKTPNARFARVKSVGLARVLDERPRDDRCPVCGYTVVYSKQYKMLDINWKREAARQGLED